MSRVAVAYLVGIVRTRKRIWRSGERGEGRLVTAPGASCRRRGIKVAGRARWRTIVAQLSMSVVEREKGGRRPSDAVEMADGGRRRSDAMEMEDGDRWSNDCGGERRGKAVAVDHVMTVRTPRRVESDFSGRTQQRSERNTKTSAGQCCWVVRNVMAHASVSVRMI
jgi:hypothetical protein